MATDDPQSSNMNHNRHSESQSSHSKSRQWKEMQELLETAHRLNSDQSFDLNRRHSLQESNQRRSTRQVRKPAFVEPYQSSEEKELELRPRSKYREFHREEEDGNAGEEEEEDAEDRERGFSGGRSTRSSRNARKYEFRRHTTTPMTTTALTETTATEEDRRDHFHEEDGEGEDDQHSRPYPTRRSQRQLQQQQERHEQQQQQQQQSFMISSDEEFDDVGEVIPSIRNRSSRAMSRYGLRSTRSQQSHQDSYTDEHHDEHPQEHEHQPSHSGEHVEDGNHRQHHEGEEDPPSSDDQYDRSDRRHGRRQGYRLRPRTEPKNYKIRLPLYEASPKKSEQRRKQMYANRVMAGRWSSSTGALGLQTNYMVNQNNGGLGSGSAMGSAGGWGWGLFGAGWEKDASDQEEGEEGAGADPWNLLSSQSSKPQAPAAVSTTSTVAAGGVSDLPPSASATELDLLRARLGYTAQASSSANPSQPLPAPGTLKSLTDSDPLAVDQSVDFTAVGGLDKHIQSLKEMVILPLLYPELFARFGLTPPRGVLFHGPPGTGKTLLARALANACSTPNGQRVNFFMRKGADVLSKWVGESERQLKALFDQAKALQPSIIFFDELDGLAPVRSAKQDQIHASIVTTLLALMDGLDQRGQVLVIGATNRIDAIDSALRRPGRFDREFYFPLPHHDARKDILRIHTRRWDPQPSEEVLEELAHVTKGYGGSDLKAVCTEAALAALERRYPQIYQSNEKLALDWTTVKVERQDFARCLRRLVPAAYRMQGAVALGLPEHLQPLLGSIVQRVVESVRREIPAGLESVGGSAVESRDVSLLHGTHVLLQSFRPRLLIHSPLDRNGQQEVAAAVLHELEGIHVELLSLSTLYQDTARSPEAAIVQFFVEIRRRKPAIIFIPDMHLWWQSVSDVVRVVFKTQLEYLAPADPIMLLATAKVDSSDRNSEDLDYLSLFTVTNGPSKEIMMPLADAQSRRAFFTEVLKVLVAPATGIRTDEETGIYFVHPSEFLVDTLKKKETLVPVAKVPPPPPKKLTIREIRLLHEYDQSVFRKLRMLLREFCHEFIRLKDYKALTKNLNPLEDYGDVVKFDAHDLLERVEGNVYTTIKQFRNDLIEMLEGFRALIMARRDMMRFTNINSLGDIIEEWLRGLSPDLIRECLESSAREKRLKQEYDELTKNLMAEQRKMFEKRLRQAQRALTSHDEDDYDDDSNENVRTSGRLRGETPAFQEGLPKRQYHRRQRSQIIDDDDDTVKTLEEDDEVIDVVGVEDELQPEDQQEPIESATQDTDIVENVKNVTEQPDHSPEAPASVNDARTSPRRSPRRKRRHDDAQEPLDVELVNSADEQPATKHQKSGKDLAKITDESSNIKRQKSVEFMEASENDEPEEPAADDAEQNETAENGTMEETVEGDGKEATPEPEIPMDPIPMHSIPCYQSELVDQLIDTFVSNSKAFTIDRLEQARIMICRALYDWTCSVTKIAKYATSPHECPELPPAEDLDAILILTQKVPQIFSGR